MLSRSKRRSIVNRKTCPVSVLVRLSVVLVWKKRSPELVTEPEIVSRREGLDPVVAHKRKLLALLPSTAALTGWTFTLIEPAQLMVVSARASASVPCRPPSGAERPPPPAVAQPRVGMVTSRSLLQPVKGAHRPLTSVMSQICSGIARSGDTTGRAHEYAYSCARPVRASRCGTAVRRSSEEVDDVAEDVQGGVAAYEGVEVAVARHLHVADVQVRVAGV
ncbi:hypothetical protein GCM10020221_32190 [Streptomyces thioluteus]|uniref:Uncharacterized protein n=1 Tax=Streptomyces thioluteus TaxID=66431 RepID=A0ABN3X2S8_STRTU